MKVGDIYVYKAEGQDHKHPWFVEIVKIYDRQVAYTWTTKSCVFNELHAQSNYISEFLREFKEAEND